MTRWSYQLLNTRCALLMNNLAEAALDQPNKWRGSHNYDEIHY